MPPTFDPAAFWESWLKEQDGRFEKGRYVPGRDAMESTVLRHEKGPERLARYLVKRWSGMEIGEVTKERHTGSIPRSELYLARRLFWNDGRTPAFDAIEVWRKINMRKARSLALLYPYFSAAGQLKVFYQDLRGLAAAYSPEVEKVLVEVLSGEKDRKIHAMVVRGTPASERNDNRPLVGFIVAVAHGEKRPAVSMTRAMQKAYDAAAKKLTADHGSCAACGKRIERGEERCDDCWEKSFDNWAEMGENF